MEASELECCLTVEHLNSNGVVTKRRTYKSITVVLGRDEFRDIALRIVSSRSPLGKTFLLKELTIHKRFLQEGKATIKLLTQKRQLMFLNCPPNQLAAFLKCLLLKLAQSKQNGIASNRRRLLSDRARSFENISPLTDKDFTVGCKKRPLEDKNGVTPKRIKTTGKESDSSFGNEEHNGAARKRLSSLSSFQMNLIPEQMAVVNAIRAGKSVFFTGGAGTGKSYLLKRLITLLPPQSTFITASTGAAACHIGGTTLHAFAGIGSGSAPLAQCVDLASRPGRAQQWRRCKHLIIDEISMVESTYFDKLEAVARAVRKKENIPFGGIQLILSGDFLQLPPVTKQQGPKKFCFQAESWSECVETTIELKHVFRQKDPLFISILQNVRVGSCSDALVSKLTATKNQLIEQGGILATKLCTHKENVNQINDIHLTRLPGEKKVFEATDSDSGMSAMLDSHVPVSYALELKVGAQVMLAKNLNVLKGLVNGARGIIKGFDEGSAGYPIVKFVSGIEEIIGSEKWVVSTPGGGTVTRRQLPLKLAWAVSIHKSQGMTLDCVEISLSRVFEYGQAYVALSRARSLQGLRVLDFDSKCVRAHPDVLRYYARLQWDTKVKKANTDHLNFQNEDKENIYPC